MMYVLYVRVKSEPRKPRMSAFLNVGFTRPNQVSRDRVFSLESVMTAAALSPATARKGPRERRKHLRKDTLWHGTLRTARGSIPCNVLNLSVRGARVEIEGSTVGDSVTLVMEPLGEFLGVVIWQ